MLFNLFGKKDNEADNHVFIDRAYVSTTAKMMACAELAKKEPNHVFICWFADTATQFKEFFRQQELDEDLVTEIHYVHASKLINKIPVFAEHYPLHSRELDLIKNWEAKNIVVYSALDEALFRYFGSDKLIPLMKMLGMKEDEVIEHAMVTKSIIRGQQKIAEQVTVEQSAASQEEWMRKNIK
jgi:hypothetical protein